MDHAKKKARILNSFLLLLISAIFVEGSGYRNKMVPDRDTLHRVDSIWKWCTGVGIQRATQGTSYACRACGHRLRGPASRSLCFRTSRPGSSRTGNIPLLLGIFIILGTLRSETLKWALAMLMSVASLFILAAWQPGFLSRTQDG